MTIAYEYRPGTLYLNVTNRCSNACTFCVRNNPGFRLGPFAMRLDREPTVEEVLAAVTGRPHEVVFCGFGEPTLRLDLVREAGRALRARGLRVRLNTNGQAALLAGRDPMADLDGALDAVNVSLNAPDAATYQDLCRPEHGEQAYLAMRRFLLDGAARFADVTASVVGHTLDAGAVARCRAIARHAGARFRVH